jgi:hypothetical protein
MVEAERENFAQHLIAAGVTAGIPAGGESEHANRSSGVQEFRSKRLESLARRCKLFIAWNRINTRRRRKAVLSFCNS